MTNIKIFIIYAICFYLVIILIMFIFQRSLLYLPSKEKIDQSYYAETGLKKIEFITSDGYVLKSLFKRPSRDKSIIMVFHGNAGHVGHRVEKFRPFLEEGYGLFLVEYRGYGENSGKPSENGFYKDGQAAINFLSEQNIPKNKTILYGESLGCGLAVKFSTQYTFEATILEAPYTSIADVASRHYWYLPAKLLVLDRFDIISIIKNIKSPLLVIHGEKDNVISINFGKKVFKSAPETKKAIFVSDAGHNNLYEFKIYDKIKHFLKELNK
jgi:fermentation-respiration switch protein FrsA (DUF1100 family)